ncbi:hypothetical protein DFH06DRAFT_1131015 [Mycena polygramma]|nr:hypothetical protein DFH06DRAFT_1131015 [Mycena polygramma]
MVSFNPHKSQAPPPTGLAASASRFAFLSVQPAPMTQSTIRALIIRGVDRTTTTPAQPQNNAGTRLSRQHRPAYSTTGTVLCGAVHASRTLLSATSGYRSRPYRLPAATRRWHVATAGYHKGDLSTGLPQFEYSQIFGLNAAGVVRFIGRA